MGTTALELIDHRTKDHSLSPAEVREEPPKKTPPPPPKETRPNAGRRIPTYPQRAVKPSRMVGTSVWQQRKCAVGTAAAAKGKSFVEVRDDLTELFCKLIDENPGSSRERANQIELCKVLVELCNVRASGASEGQAIIDYMSATPSNLTLTYTGEQERRNEWYFEHYFSLQSVSLSFLRGEVTDEHIAKIERYIQKFQVGVARRAER